MVTWFGLLVRRHMSLPLSMVMTYSTLVVEIAAPLLILNPVARYRTRSLSILLYPALHFACAAFLNLGQFSFNMMGYFPLMLSVADWKIINRWFGPPESRARTVRFDPSSPLLSMLARLFARLDAFDRLTFEAPSPKVSEEDVSGSDDAKPASPSRWVVSNPATGSRTTGVRAMAECIDALALGRLLPGCSAPRPVKGWSELVGGWMVRNESTIEADFALEAMTPADVLDAPLNTLPVAPPVRRWLQRRAVQMRELAVVVLMVTVASQVLMENKAVPPQLKWGQPKWMQQILGYPRMFQGWGMFSSDVPTGERMLYVDAVTFGGRHVDPFNEAGSRVADLPVERIPPHMEQDEFWCDYTNRIPERQVYWRMLKEWILAYHLRTMRREDRIISFEAKLLESDSPPPGELEPRNFRTKVMMTDRDPDRWRPRAALPRNSDGRD
jgi:hypothetical protein